jgi:monoamine oxidase
MTSASKRADVLVIGAGMAGIAAAHYLQQFVRQLAQDVRVIVLEGRPDRIGGRIWTDRDWPEAPIDLGASWVSHLTINPLGAVAKEHGIKLVDSNLSNVHLVQGDGKALSEAETNDAMLRFFGIYADVKLRAEERRERGKRDVDAGRARARKDDRRRSHRRSADGSAQSLRLISSTAAHETLEVARRSVCVWHDSEHSGRIEHQCVQRPCASRRSSALRGRLDDTRVQRTGIRRVSVGRARGGTTAAVVVRAVTSVTTSPLDGRCAASRAVRKSHILRDSG